MQSRPLPLNHRASPTAMRLRTRMFVTLLSVCTVLVLTMAVLFQLGFERGLDRFLLERQQSLLQQWSQDFAEYHAEHGDFAGISLRMMIWSEEDGRNQLPRTLVLLDDERVQLLGPTLPNSELVLAPVIRDNQTVGWVGLPAGSRHRDTLASNFRDSQIETLIRTILPTLLLALFGTWLLARALLKPIEQSAALARRLGDGDYHEKIAENRSDEIGELMRGMNRLAQSLAQASAARERWLADISHELRTPVAVLQGELEALIDGVRPASPDHLRSLHQEILHLKRLLDDLHDLSLADVGALRYRFAMLDFTALCGDALEAMRGRFSDHKLTLNIQLPTHPIMLQGDSTRLRQLLDNLLENSLKYTDPGGRVDVTMQATDRGARLDIADSAPGVSDADRQRLFEHLFRVEASRNRQLGGAGLGLALCERIVSAHRGSIEASASPFGGLQMTVLLDQEA